MGRQVMRHAAAFALTAVSLWIASVDSAAVPQPNPKADQRHYDVGHKSHYSGYGSEYNSGYGSTSYGDHDGHYHHHVHKYESPVTGYLRGSLALTAGGGLNPYLGLGYTRVPISPLAGLMGLYPSMLGYGFPEYGLGGLGLGGSSLYGGFGGIGGGIGGIGGGIGGIGGGIGGIGGGIGGIGGGIGGIGGGIWGIGGGIGGIGGGYGW